MNNMEIINTDNIINKFLDKKIYNKIINNDFYYPQDMSYIVFKLDKIFDYPEFFDFDAYSIATEHFSDLDFHELEIFNYDSAAEEYIENNIREFREKYMYKYDIEDEDDIDDINVIDEYKPDVIDDMINDYSFYQSILENHIDYDSLDFSVLEYCKNEKLYRLFIENIDFILIENNKKTINKVYISKKENLILFKLN